MNCNCYQESEIETQRIIEILDAAVRLRIDSAANTNREVESKEAPEKKNMEYQEQIIKKVNSILGLLICS